MATKFSPTTSKEDCLKQGGIPCYNADGQYMGCKWEEVPEKKEAIVINRACKNLVA